jgi:spore coat polysaccharide biosynthesis protein SpsF
MPRQPEPETAQAAFWRGPFGDAYTERNAPEAAQLRARVALWASILAHMPTPPASILEVGANAGTNLRALRCLSDAAFFAVEPNAKARQVLLEDGVVPAANLCDGLAAAIDLPDAAVDLAFTSGVLIHIHPDDLPSSCRDIHRVSRRYIACIEYFADRPEEVAYRGHADRLFKRDFGAFWLDSFPDLRPLGCGFAWRRLTGLDNLTWWLFEKP